MEIDLKNVQFESRGDNLAFVAIGRDDERYIFEIVALVEVDFDLTIPTSDYGNPPLAQSNILTVKFRTRRVLVIKETDEQKNDNVVGSLSDHTA